MKAPEVMTNDELQERCGIPAGCPNEIVRAILLARLARYSKAEVEAVANPIQRAVFERVLEARSRRLETKAGVEAVRAAALEQATWTAERKEDERLLSLRRMAVRGTL